MKSAHILPREVTQAKLDKRAKAGQRHRASQTYTLAERVEASAVEFAQHPCIRYGDQQFSYSQANARMNQVAHAGHALGLRCGDVVALCMENRPAFLFAWLGLAKLGVKLVFLNTNVSGKPLVHAIESTGAKLILMGEECLGLLAATDTPAGLRYWLWPDAENPAAAALRERCELDFSQAMLQASESNPPVEWRAGLVAGDPALYIFTSGTTGLPKGCVQSHGDMLYTCASFVPVAMGLQPDSVLLNFLPEFWIAGENAGLLFPVFSGCRLVLLARWDALAFMAAVQHYRVSHCGLLVDSAAEVLEHSDVSRYDFRSLRRTGSISFTKKLTRDYRERWRELTGCTLFEFSFGMTETHTCDTFTYGLQDDDFDLTSAPTFVGLPVPGTEFKVCDFTSGELLPLGSEGELCVRSPALMQGYWQRPEESAAALKDGWLHTGDLGQITEQGFIRYLGRRKEMLKVNGMSVFPSELEALLGQHPALLASAVIGRPDAQRGQQPVAFVVLKPGSAEDAQTLTAWCRDAMASYKVPEIRVVAALPMTATGKVKKNELENLL